ncbi:MAG: hypothetical protein JW775_00480, partial [Candidatus Aminicenantes bacterium]|nr:hypothetical protein [Candidatus Aminicenantes bacterium]
IFPHHENEIAQSEGANGVKFVNYWLHCHHLIVDGEKMAKSKGNAYRIPDIAGRGYDPLDLRFLLIATHYRKMLNFTFEALDQARTARRRIGNFLAELEAVPSERAGSAPVEPLIEEARAGFVAGLEDDLNIAEALASLFTLIKRAYPLLGRGEVSGAGASKLAALLTEIDRVLGVKPSPAAAFSGRIGAGGIPSEKAFGAPTVEAKGTGATTGEPEGLEAEVLAKIEARREARAAKDFARADAIREELLDMGVILEDTKDGVRWKRVRPPEP